MWYLPLSLCFLLWTESYRWKGGDIFLEIHFNIKLIITMKHCHLNASILRLGVLTVNTFSWKMTWDWWVWYNLTLPWVYRYTGQSASLLISCQIYCVKFKWPSVANPCLVWDETKTRVLFRNTVHSQYVSVLEVSSTLRLSDLRVGLWGACICYQCFNSSVPDFRSWTCDLKPEFMWIEILDMAGMLG